MPGLSIGVGVAGLRRLASGIIVPPAPVFSLADPRLRWSPPDLTNPTELALPIGFQGQPAGVTAANDLLVRPYNGTRNHTFNLTAARRARYIGGRTSWGPTSGSRAEQHTGIAQSAFYEGQWISMIRAGDVRSAGGQASAYTSYPDVYNQMQLWDGVNGSDAGRGAGFKLGYSVRNVCLDKITISTNDQGLFLPPQKAISGAIYLSRINVKFSDTVNPSSFAFWFFDDQAQYDATSHVIYVDDCWVAPRAAATGIANVAYCAAKGTRATDATGDYVWFPEHPRIQSIFGGPGKIRIGTPPGGDFVQAASVGVGYVSPGYQLAAFA